MNDRNAKEEKYNNALETFGGDDYEDFYA